MRISLSKAVAVGGLCALFVGAGTTAFAQGYDHPDRHFDQSAGYGDRHFGPGQDRWDGRHDQGPAAAERYRLARLHRVYAQAARSGHYGVAERAHLHALAIRRDLRYAHRDLRQDRPDWHGDRSF